MLDACRHKRNRRSETVWPDFDYTNPVVELPKDSLTSSGQAAREITRDGVNGSRSQIGAFGQGFYTTTEADPFYGDTDIRVAIRTVYPPIGDSGAVGEIVDALARRLLGRGATLTPMVARAIREQLVREGYDAIIVKDGGGDGIDFIIALRDDIVRVVEP